MKRIALVLVLVLLAAAAFGQGFGRMVISGGTNGWFSMDMFVDEYDRAYTTLDLYGWVGYFIIQNMAIGPYVSFSLERYTVQAIEYTYSYRNFYVGIQFAYFIFPDSRASPFVQSLVAYRIAAEAEQSGGFTFYSDEWNALMIQEKLGFEIMITDSVGFSLGPYYQFYMNLESDYKSQEIGVFFGFDVFLGPF